MSDKVLQANEGSDKVRALIERYGKPLLIAYGVFVVGSLFFNAISMEMLGMKQGKPLFDLASALSQGGGGGSGIKLLVVLAYGSIGLPLVWADKRAWLALVLPLVSVLWAFWSVRQALGPMAELFSYGLGFYLCLGSALVLAFMGVQRHRAA